MIFIVKKKIVFEISIFTTYKSNIPVFGPVRLLSFCLKWWKSVSSCFTDAFVRNSRQKFCHCLVMAVTAIYVSLATRVPPAPG